LDIYAEAKDPSEVKDYTWDWSPALETSETVSSHTVTMISAAGATLSPAASLASNVSRVWLSGGTHGERVIYTIQAITSLGRTLETACGVEIVDTVLGAVAPTDLENLKADLAAVRAAKIELATGKMVTEIWRDGRRIVKGKASMSDLLALESNLLGLIRDAEATESNVPKRRAIPILWG